MYGTATVSPTPSTYLPMARLLTCAVVPEWVQAMHRQSFYISCEVLCCSVLAVDSEWMLVVALVKQKAMATLHQLLNTRGKSILCRHAPSGRAHVLCD